MSLARSFISDPHGMIFIHVSCDQPLMNSPITKLSFVILTTNGRKNLKILRYAQNDTLKIYEIRSYSFSIFKSFLLEITSFS